MTKAEFDAWTKETKFSEKKWCRDFITGENSKLYASHPEWFRGRLQPVERELFYKGGVDGVYIEIAGDGTVNVGEYEGAIPHIGEAIFTVKHSNKPVYHGKPASSLNEGFAAITERLGLGFLIDLFSVA